VSDAAFDVIIIGTGAGGATLARRLAPSGQRILLLERGDWLPREPENWNPAQVLIDDRYVSPDEWSDADGRAFAPAVHYLVGGATKLTGAVLHRMRREDFGEVRHRDGISPAWPISYEDLEPYYTQAEQLYGVHGVRGEDPTEPGTSAPYPFPPVSHEPRIAQLAEDLLNAGLNPFHTPLGVLLREENGLRSVLGSPVHRPDSYSACIRCPTCDGFPCLVLGKSDAELIGVRPALEHHNVTLLTRANAVRLATNATGTAVTEVVVEHDGQEERYTGSIIVLACGAINSAKLLLASATEAHPAGLANGSDEVGRNYQHQVRRTLLALSRQPNPSIFPRTLGISDFYFEGPNQDHPLGMIHVAGPVTPEVLRVETAVAQAFRLAGDRESARPASAHTPADVARHAMLFHLSTEDLPRSENRVMLDEQGRVRLRHVASNLGSAQELQERLRALLPDLGLEPELLIPLTRYLHSGPESIAYQAGTCRFGPDPTTSVLDRDCRTHELDNLYVVDASFLPSTGAVDPALTVMANALRVGDHLLERLGAAARPATVGMGTAAGVSTAWRDRAE
jgi:choline dehydrogenase-like flavoprotein